MKNFLKTQKTKIVDSKGKPVCLRGVNLGGWLMMEGYIMHSLNLPEQCLKNKWIKVLGRDSLKEFELRFRENFIREEDIVRIAQMGFNCIRVPFNCRLISKSDGTANQDGIFFLDKIVRLSRKHKIWIILDLHAAFGAQNHDWHSDSFGKAELWTNKSNRLKTYQLWEFLADRYKDEEYIAGYDILNEAVLKDTALLNTFYKEVIRHIRRVDRNHILFIEGNTWATDIKCLEIYDDPNWALSIHFYTPNEFSANLIPHLKYPMKTKAGEFTITSMRKILEDHQRFSRKHSLPVFAGEFGVNVREGLYGEDVWLKDVLKIFNEYGFHWTYWTYKSIKNSMFPDGIFSYFPNAPWVNRQGPKLGWETWADLWPSRKSEMIRSWRTDQFQENVYISKILKAAAKTKLS